MIHKRLSRLSDALGDRPYLDGGRFTAGDLMMTTVLRITDGKGLLDRYSNLVGYKARCQRVRHSRPRSPLRSPISKSANRYQPELHAIGGEMT